jgi:hypothetical protein
MDELDAAAQSTPTITRPIALTDHEINWAFSLPDERLEVADCPRW